MIKLFLVDLEANDVRISQRSVALCQIRRANGQGFASLRNGMSDIRRFRRMERRYSDRRSFGPHRDDSYLPNTLLLRLRFAVLVAVRDNALAYVSAISSPLLDPRGLLRRNDGYGDTFQYARSSVRSGRQSTLLVLRMESIHGPLRRVQVRIDTDLLCELIRHVAKHESFKIYHANQLYRLREHGSDTSVIGRTALLYSALRLLSSEYEKTAQVADLYGIAHDGDGQFLAILRVRQ